MTQMGVLAVLALVPHVVLLPPDAPSDLQPIAETCAHAIATSPSLQVTRLVPAAMQSTGVAERARAELAAAAQAYRELSFRDAKERAERAVAMLEAEAVSDEDFGLIVEARLRLALTLLAQRKSGPAQRVLEAAARIRPDASVTEGDYPPNLVAAFAHAVTMVRRVPAAPVPVTVRTAIEGIEPTIQIDGRPFGGAGSGMPPGDHVVVADAPGHRAVRQVIRLPLAAPVTIALEPLAAVAPGIVVVMAIERVGARLRIRLHRQEGADASRDVDAAGAPVAARELAETLLGVPRVVASTGTGTAVGTAGNDRVATNGRDGRSAGRGHPTSDRHAREERGGSVFGTWWFWTITGSVVVVGFLGLAAANNRDPGTDVHVGLAP